MSSPVCTYSPHDNTCNLIHIIAPPPIDIGVPYSAFYYLSPCGYSYQPLRADQGAEFSFLQGGISTLLFYLVHTYEKGLGEKDNAVCFNSSRCKTLRHRRWRGNILSDAVTLCRNLREAEAVVTHLVVSSTAYDYDSSARLAEVYRLQEQCS